MTLKLKLVSSVCGLSLLVLGAGCSSLDLKKSPVPWPVKSEKLYDTPDRIIAVWTDTVYQQAGKMPTRGFGGRVYFYNSEGKVIPVDGELVIYAYDDSTAGSHDQPTRKYAFTPEQLTRYCSESDIGTSYNIWIPWDKVGNEEKQISLFPVFIDKAGRMVRGNFANGRLPGRRVLTDEEKRGFYVSHQRKPHQAGNQNGVRQVQYQTVASDAEPEAKEKMETTTIRIPRSLAERMAMSPPVVLQAQRSGQPVHVSSTWSAPLSTSRTSTSVDNSNNAGTVSPGVRESSANSQQLHATPQGDQMVPQRQPSMQSLPRTGQVTPQAQPASAPARSSRLPSYPYPENGGMQSAPLGQQGFIGADPQHSVSATSRAWARQHEQSARFEPPRFRVPAAPGVQRHLGRETFQPSPLTPRPDLPSQH